MASKKVHCETQEILDRIAANAHHLQIDPPETYGQRKKRLIKTHGRELLENMGYLCPETGYMREDDDIPGWR